MSAFAVILIGSLTFTTLAPVPPESRPDPIARGYVGVTLGEGVIIQSVEPNKPAAKAGLRSGDIIVRVGTFSPATYSDAVTHICSFRPGAVVEIEVQRGPERKVFKVKLDCRPPELDNPGRYPGQPLPIDD